MTELARIDLNHDLGPFYSTDALARHWRIGDAEVLELVAAREVLSLVQEDGSHRAPAFQFDGSGAKLPGLAETQRALEPAFTDPVTVAYWLRTPNADVDGEAPVDVLRRGNTAAVVRAAARLNARIGTCNQDDN